MNIHWPYTKLNNCAPWYLVVWRAPWYLTAMIARLLLAISVAGMHVSLEAGLDNWEDTQ